MKQYNSIDPSILGDEELFDILCINEDRISLSLVREILARQERFIDRLIEIIHNTHVWECDVDQWITRHATFILGVIGGKEVITPLIMSLRRAAFYNDDWILDELPSIFGSIGEPAYEPLRNVVMDRSNDWEIRVTALESLAAITIKHSSRERAVFDLAAGIMNDQSEDVALRGCAGGLLLDFCQKTYEKSLRAFAEEGRLRQETDPTDFIDFYEEEIDEMLKKDCKHLDYYNHDWLLFYNEESYIIRENNRRMDREWWWRRFFWWWEERKLRREYKKISEDISNSREPR